jgi:hypothetical protein
MNTKDKISLVLLVGFYGLLVLFNVRYFPGDPLQTFIATAGNILTLAAVAVALTLGLVSVMQKVVGERLPWDRVLRFYLFFAILIWAFAIMYTYFDMVEREKAKAAESVPVVIENTVQPADEKIDNAEHGDR